MRDADRRRLSGWLRGIGLAFVVVASTAIIVGMVNLSPASGQAGEVEAKVLAKQLEFILKMNSAFLGFLGIIGALLTWFFKNNLEDAREVAGRMVREELDQRIKGLVQEEFRYWEMSARSERVVGQTYVAYYLPDAQAEPREYGLVKNRGFRRVAFCTQLDEVKRSPADVVIFDAQNWTAGGGSRVVELPTNNQVTLLGHAVNGAYVAFGDRNIPASF
ncbi:MAG: hypothetical protein WBA10_14105 [Elainellaceae cyanobacterium]